MTDKPLLPEGLVAYASSSRRANDSGVTDIAEARDVAALAWLAFDSINTNKRTSR